MIIENLLKSDFNFSGLTLLLLVIVVTVSILSLVASVVVLSRRLKKATTPKFGFAGKPIYPLLAILFISVSIPLGLVAVRDQTALVQKADERVDLVLDYEIVERRESEVLVTFTMVPTINGSPWSDKEYDIFWFFKGPTETEEFEFGRSKEDPGGILITLKKGSYDVRVLVTFEDRSEELELNIVLD